MIQGGNARPWRFPVPNPLRTAWTLGLSTFQRHPFLVKTLSSGVGFAVGDAFTQMATRKESDPYDWPRTAAMGAAGISVAGPLGYLLIVWMEGNVMPSSPTSRLAMTTKVTLDQILGGILWQAALIAINEPYREAAVGLSNRVRISVKKRLEKLKPHAIVTR